MEMCSTRCHCTPATSQLLRTVSHGMLLLQSHVSGKLVEYKMSMCIVWFSTPIGIKLHTTQLKGSEADSEGDPGALPPYRPGAPHTSSQQFQMWLGRKSSGKCFHTVSSQILGRELLWRGVGIGCRISPWLMSIVQIRLLKCTAPHQKFLTGKPAAFYLCCWQNAAGEKHVFSHQ